jgi:hypothetical protein
LNLNSRPAIDPRWIESVQSPLDGFVSCEIELLDMNLAEQDTDYDWRTNTSTGSAPEVLFSGSAQVQVYRFTLTMDAPVGSVDQVRNARFTVNPNDFGDIDVRKGQQVRVTACEVNPSLMTYQFVVNSGLNSGLNFRRTIETEVDMARVVR